MDGYGAPLMSVLLTSSNNIQHQLKNIQLVGECVVR